MSNILVFDASSSWCSVALSVNGTLYSAAEKQPRKHAQLIMPMIEGLCQQAGIQPNQLEGIAFGKGPGSFTGLRIAISVAQGLSLATGAKLYGISSLQALAWQAMKLTDADHVIAIMNAHMGEVFFAAYERGENNNASAAHSPLLTATLGDALTQPELVDISALNTASTWLGAGDGFEFIEQMPQVAEVIRDHDIALSPMAESMMDLALWAWQNNQFTTAEKQQPVYLRDTVAWKKLAEQPSLLKK